MLRILNWFHCLKCHTTFDKDFGVEDRLPHTLSCEGEVFSCRVQELKGEDCQFEGKIEKEICTNCGFIMKPALDCKNYANGYWDGHTYWCECFPKLRLSIG